MSVWARRLLLLGLVGVGVGASLAAAATLPGVPRPAPLASFSSQPATNGCAARVVDDWVDDGSVDGRYALHCYRQAIRTLPEDMRIYSSAPDDLARAMREAAHAPTSTGSRTLAGTAG